MSRYNVPQPPPNTTVCGKRFLLRCCIDAYREPSRTGELSERERDAVASTIALRWHSRSPEGSCAWHEIALYRGTPCHCSPCRKQRQAVTA